MSAREIITAARGREVGRAPSTARTAVAASRRRDRTRLTIALCGLVMLLLAALATRVLLGGYTVTVADFVRILRGTVIPGASYIVLESKLPRALTAGCAGAALGAAGALFRRTLRNPLASPDVLGVTQGAAAAAVGALLVTGGRGTALILAALAGGLAATAAVLGLSGADARLRAAGGVAASAGGQRLIVAGIAVAALCQSVVAGAMLQMNEHDLPAAAVWLAGSLSAVTWPQLAVLALALVPLLPVAGLLHSRLAPADLGGELAHGLGAHPARTGTAALLVGSLLAAAATAVVGPLAFVALLATPLARGLAGGRPSLPAAALTGAVIVVLADFIGGEAFGSSRLPAGVLTGACGAPLMLWLLIRSRRHA